MDLIPAPITPKEHYDMAHAVQLAIRWGSTCRYAEEVTEHMIQIVKQENRNVHSIKPKDKKMKEVFVRTSVKQTKKQMSK